MAEPSWQPYWERAGENLRAAETLLRGEPPLPNAATSRAYYAAFHAAIALLLAHTDYRPKGNEWAHDQVQAQLNIHGIRRRKLLEAKHGPTLLYLLHHRRAADYLPRGVSQKKADEALKRATEFLAAIQALLEEQA
jgi:uncharacterized protein (UPF0332 family)